jgi:hypothetical protein
MQINAEEVLDKTDKITREVMPAGRPWPPEARAAGLNAYLATGSVYTAADVTGIPKSTIHEWLRDPANEHILDEARRIHARAAAVDAAAVWKLATDHISDALQNGDWRLSPKGDPIRMPVSAKDAAYIAGTMADKSRQWGELAYGGQAPADLSPEKAEALAREILRIDREMERRNTVDITTPEDKVPHTASNGFTTSTDATEAGTGTGTGKSTGVVGGSAADRQQTEADG